MPRMTLLPAVMNGRSDLERLFAGSDRMFDRYLTRTADSRVLANLDVYETAQGYTMEWEVPGVQQEGLAITVSGTQLTIQAHRPQPAQDERKYHITERTHGEFQRTLTMPTEVDADGIEATLKDGVLSLFIPKQASKQPKQIQINVG